MIIRSLIAVLAAFVSVAAPPAAGQQEFEKNILTGGPNGTYIQIGRDISELAAGCGLTLNVRESAGSLENFLGVRQRPLTQFGIVQSDVLEYLKTFEEQDPDIARAVRGVQIAFPLYNEEVHILATREVETLADLSGARVAIGVEDSGTFLTASLVLDLARATPAEKLTIDPGEGLDALIDGRIDALFYVTGAPASLFADPRIDPEKHHLLPVDDPTLNAVYTPVRIEAETYPWLDAPVDAIAVQAALMTYAYRPSRNAYHFESCRAVAQISHLIARNFDILQTSGHPKWREVDLTDIPPGWSIGECVSAGLAPDFTLDCGPAGGGPAKSDASAIYRQHICATIGC